MTDKQTDLFKAALGGEAPPATPTAQRKPTVALSSGGTGGHIFPALALAERLAARGHRVILFTDPRGARFLEGQTTPAEIVTLDVSSPAGGFMAKLKGMLSILRAAWRVRPLLSQLDIRAVVGFGGYPSLPALIAALFRKCPIILHDQNARMGAANRLMSRYAHTLALSFATTVGSEGHTPAERVVTGNPVRTSILALRDRPYPTPKPPLTLLVMGGSQGASIFSSVVPQALAMLLPEERAQFHFIQQCRAETLDEVTRFYGELGVSAELAPFFSDVADKIAAAHIVVARAGATTVAELCIAGRPALYVPLPHAIADEQTENARTVEKAGGGWVIAQAAFSPDTLAAWLRACLVAPDRLPAIAAAARQLGQPHAAERLEACVLGVVGA